MAPMVRVRNAGSVLSSASLDAENKVLRTRKLAALHLSFGVVRYDAGGSRAVFVCGHAVYDDFSRVALT